jgi:hypothetical protein
VQTQCLNRAQGLAALLGAGLACSSALGAAASAPASAPAAPVNCAVITDPAGNLRAHPITAFLEATLSSDPRFRLLERDQLDALSREQQIQVMFSADSAPQRMALGALLKVDLMIMLRVDKAPHGEELQVAICETQAGYRLRVRQFDWPARPDTGDQVLELVDQAVQKWQTPSRAVFAVPRFLCKDFIPNRADYRDAFARSLEQGLVAYPSIVLIELPEATAISNELGLHNSGQALERQLPYYLSGEYETTQKDGAALFSIKVALRRGAQTLKTYRCEKSPFVEANGFIAGIPREVLRDTLLTARQNPELEAMDLVRQAETFSRSGDDETALSLISAAILLQPKDPVLLEKGLKYIGEAAYAVRSRKQDGDSQVADGYDQLGKNYRERLSRIKQAQLVAEGKGWMVGIEEAKRDRAARMEYIRRVQDSPEAEIEILKLLIPHVEYSYTNDRRVTELRPSRGLLNQLKDPAVQSEIDEVAALPGAVAQGVAKRLKAFAANGEEAIRKDEEMRKQWVGRDLNPTAFVHYRQGNTVVYESTTRGEAPSNWSTPRKQQETAEFRMDPIELRVASQPGQRSAFASDTAELPPFAGWLPCGPGMDVLWTGNEIFAMREPGVLHSVYREESPCFQAYSNLPQMNGDERPLATSPFAFDGKYVWAPAFAAEKPHMVVLDPQTGSTRTVGPEQGTPPMDQGLCVAPLGPGVVCVAAGFRKDKHPRYPADAAWCAVLRLDSSQQVKIEFLLRANEQPPAGERFRPSTDRAAYGFCPAGIFVLRDPAASRDTVILLRQTAESWISGAQALAIDVQSHDVRPIEQELPNMRQDLVLVSGDALYMAQEDQLWKVSVPGPTVEHQRIAVPGTRVGPAKVRGIGRIEDAFHILGEGGWAVTSAFGEEGQVLLGAVPSGLQRFGPIISSRNYGTVVLGGGSTENMRPFAVKIAPGVVKQVQDRAKREGAEIAENRKALQKVQQQQAEHGPLVEEEPAQTPLEMMATWAPVGAIGLAIPAVLIWFVRRGRARRRVTENVASKEVSK